VQLADGHLTPSPRWRGARAGWQGLGPKAENQCRGCRSSHRQFFGPRSPEARRQDCQLVYREVCPDIVASRGESVGSKEHPLFVVHLFGQLGEPARNVRLA